jgi:hypothetical protein
MTKHAVRLGTGRTSFTKQMWAMARQPGPLWNWSSLCSLLDVFSFLWRCRLSVPAVPTGTAYLLDGVNNNIVALQLWLFR